MPHLPEQPTLDLTSLGATTKSIRVTGSRATIQIITDSNGFSTAQAELRMSLEQRSYESYQSEIRFVSSDKIRRDICVSGVQWLQLRTRVAASGADPRSRVVVNFY